MAKIECSRCNATADMTDGALPAGWATRRSSLGQLFDCPEHAQAERPRRAEPADAKPGHNSGEDAPSFSSDDVITGAAQGRLRTIIERIERLEEDKAVVGNDLKEVYEEAKGEGFDVKILRKVVRLRKMDKVKRSEEQDLIDLYMHAIEG